ncbi:hypothetical protein CPB86DRAFT_788045, partial [Serendipita vermifera]
MENFESLPNEVIQHIFGFLDRTAILGTAMASRRLRLLAEPILFRKIRIVDPESALDILRSHIQNPRIYLYVKEMTIFVQDYHPQICLDLEDQDSFKAIYLPISKGWRNLSTVDSELNIQEDFTWLKDEIMTPCIAMIVRTFIHITDLKISVSIENELLETFRAFPGGGLVDGIRPHCSILPQLHQVHLMETGLEKNYQSLRGFPDYVFWMLHPTLKRIHIAFYEGNEPESLQYPSYIEGYCIRWPTVDALLKLPNHLTEVHFVDMRRSVTISPE